MRLIVKNKGSSYGEYQFNRGPVYVGRHANSQVFLPDRGVSRQHAVFYVTTDGKWIVEDLDSANKTYLSDQPVHKSPIKTGDIVRIGDYTIEIDFSQNDENKDEPIDLSDTLTTAAHEMQVIVRKFDSEYAPPVKIAAKRIRQFANAAEAICNANGLNELCSVLLTVMARQFNVHRCWCAVRDEPSGPMTRQAGKRRDGTTVRLNDLNLEEKVNQAVEKNKYFLFPKVKVDFGEERIQSALIAPLIIAKECFGVLYVDNTSDHERFTISDIDYLIMLSIHTAAILKNF